MALQPTKAVAAAPIQEALAALVTKAKNDTFQQRSQTINKHKSIQ